MLQAVSEKIPIHQTQYIIVTTLHNHKRIAIHSRDHRGEAIHLIVYMAYSEAQHLAILWDGL